LQGTDHGAIARPLPNGIGRRTTSVRVGFGAIGVRHHSLDAGDELRIAPIADTLQIVVSVAGAVADIRGAISVATLATGEALLLSQMAAIECGFAERSAVLVVDLPGGVLQAATFTQRGEPRRLGQIYRTLSRDTRRTALGRALARLAAIYPCSPNHSGQMDAVGESLLAAIIEDLCEQDTVHGGFPIAASVQRAIARLADHDAEPVVLDQIVRAAAVARATLSRAIKDTTGISLTNFVQHARLDWARDRLGNVRESRSLAALATVAGYRPTVFTRNYQRRFGETPTQTRTRAFATR